MSRFFTRRRQTVTPRPPRFPVKGHEISWMEDLVAWAREHSDDVAVGLFDPASGDYMPHAVHTGSFFSDDLQAAYGRIRDQNTDLVERAAALPATFSVSRIADPDDLAAHAHRLRLDTP